MKKLYITLLATSTALLALTSCSSVELGDFGQPAIPDVPVIGDYSPSVIQSDISQAAASGPATVFTSADRARLEVVSQAYPRTIRLLEDMLADIRSNSPDKTVAPEIQLFNSKRPNAYALNQNLIVISTGLLETIQEFYADDKYAQDQSLAFILAHEYAHLLYRHPEKYSKAEKAIKISDTIQAGYGLMKTAQAAHLEYGGGSRSDYVEAEKAFMSAAIASPWIEAELYRFVYAPYTKREEQRADYLASDLLVATEVYNGRSGAKPIRSIYTQYDSQAMEDLRGLSKDVQETSTKAAAEIVAVAPSAAFSSSGAEAFGGYARNRMFMAGLEVTARTLKRRLDRNEVHLYYGAGQRVDAIEGYYEKHYPGVGMQVTDSVAAAFNALDAFKKENTPAAVARTAMTFLARGDIEGARRALATVTSGDRMSNMQYLLASGSVAFAAGDLFEAERLFSRATNRSDAPIRAFKNLASTYIRQGNGDRAIETLDRGAVRFSVEEFILGKMEALLSLGRTEEVLIAFEDCKRTGDDQLIKRCQSIANSALPETEESNGFDELSNTFRDGLGGILNRP
ncbi:MAG: M48 family metalloprotease [Aquisalinus sp.]|nr:M48 family metalloprotease [Aquisalinus sp.]